MLEMENDGREMNHICSHPPFSRYHAYSAIIEGVGYANAIVDEFFQSIVTSSSQFLTGLTPITSCEEMRNWCSCEGCRIAADGD